MIRLTVLILAHKNPRQLQVLVDHLLANDCAVLVHIDKKEREPFREFSAGNAARTGLRIYSCYKVYWGSFNQIRATMFLLKEALQHTQFDFVRLLSGQDLPAKPLHLFKEFLAGKRNQSFFSFAALPANDAWAGNGGLDRTELFWITDFPRWSGFFFNRLNVLIHFFQRLFRVKRKAVLPLYGGANWFTLNREAAQFVVREIESRKKFYKKFRNTRCADEILVQTIIMNSKLAGTVVNSTLCYIDWESGPEYPRTFTVDDRERILGSGEFFARKFDEKKDARIIKEILDRV